MNSILPTEEERDNKLEQLFNDKMKTDIHTFAHYAKQYAEWLGISIVKRCADVAELDIDRVDGQVIGCYIVDKQSILNVINEL